MRECRQQRAVDDECRCDTEVHRVGERVDLLAHLRRGLEQPGDAAVERVQDRGDREKRHRLGRPVVERELHRRQAEADRRDRHRARQHAQADGRPLDAGLHRGSSARIVSPPTARWPGSTSTLGALRQVGVQPRPVPDEAVGVADRHLLARLDVADDAAGDQTRDLHGHHLVPLWRADQHAVAFVVLAGGGELGGFVQAGTVHDRHHFAADRDALDMGVEDRQEDADSRQRPVGQVQFGGRHRLLDEADQPVGGSDDHAGAGRRYARRVAEERGVRARGQQAGAAQPPIAAARRGDARGLRRRTAGRRGASGGSWFSPGPPVARGLI